MTLEAELPATAPTGTATEIRTIDDAAKALRAGTITSVELTQGYLDKAQTYFDVLGAYVELTPDLALAQAAAADAAFAAGEDKGLLQGIPLAIKDIIKIDGVPTTANSRIPDAATWHQPGDATVVGRLRDAGAVFLGKATTSEYALGLPDPDKGFPIPHNPWDIERTPMGSSSGTGVATAAGLALGGLGTDTGGSVRSPAAVNGHTGLKVSFGRVPKSGVYPLGYSLDSVGPMARSAYDAAALLEVMAGYDAADPSSLDIPVPRYTELLDGDLAGIRIGVPMPYFLDHEQLLPEVRDGVLKLIDTLVGLGAVTTELELKYAEHTRDAVAIIMGAEANAYHRNDLVSRWTTYGQFTRPGLSRGSLFSAADFAQANRFRALWCDIVAAAFEQVDVLIVPTHTTAAVKGRGPSPSERLTMPSYTNPWNLNGSPAAAIPTGFSSDGLPLSAQVVGKPYGEAMVLKVADAFQRVTDHHLQVPPIEKWLS